MKVCLITNYDNRSYVNEKFIHDQLLVTLSITSKDCYDFSNTNSAYSINKQYDFALITLDYKITSIEKYDKFLGEVKIPKIFLVESIAEKHKEVCMSFLDYRSTLFTSLPTVHQNLLYSKYSNGLIFYSELDKRMFDEFYNVDKSIARTVIPPSLGKKKNIKVDFKNLKPNTNISLASPVLGSYSSILKFLSTVFCRSPSRNGIISILDSFADYQSVFEYLLLQY